MPTISALALLLMALASQVHAVSGRVVLQGAADEVLKVQIEEHLSAVVSRLESGDVSALGNAFTAEGLAAVHSLLGQLEIRNVRALHETRLMSLPKGGFEVRDIRVQVGLGETVGSPYQYMVFGLNKDGLIEDIRFSMEKRHYDDLVREGELLRDYVERQQIIQTIELYRTAYNRRDLEYIKRIFSDEAIIIVGHMIESRPELPSQEGRLQSSMLGQERIEFIHKSKGEYIDALQRVFKNNDFLRVEFDSLRVVRDLQDEALYGISLKQQWQSSTYSDTGYVFLLMDFIDEDKPLIHVRSWQPDRFDDGSMITLQDFEIIRLD